MLKLLSEKESRMESFNSKADVFDAELYLNPIDEEDLVSSWLRMLRH